MLKGIAWIAVVLLGLWIWFASGLIGNVDFSRFPPQPKPGYVWAQAGQISFATKWSPGASRPGTPNVVAAEQEETWLPSPGYDWNSAPTGKNLLGMTVPQKFESDDLSVHWVAGQTHPQYPHVTSAKTEGSWLADKGYGFTHSGETLDVAWIPGTPDPDFKHQIAGTTEGSWVMEPGYERRFFLLSSYAVWVPNTSYPGQPCIIAALEEGKWRAIDGYHFQSTAAGTVEIVSDSSVDTGKIVGGGLLALLSYAFSPKSDDDSVTGTAQRILTDEGMKAGVGTAIDGFQSGGSGACAGVRVPAGLRG
jgi:hypothetical protein